MAPGGRQDTRPSDRGRRDPRFVVPWWLEGGGRVALGAVVPVGVAAALTPIRSDTNNATVALALAVLVCLLSATTDRVTSAAAAGAAAISFDVWFTQPYGSLTISRPEDIETTVLLLGVALIVGQLAARNRRHHREVGEARLHLRRVHAMAEMVAAGTVADDVVAAVAAELVALLRLRDCWFDPSFADPPGAFIERDGGVSWGAIRWGFATLGLPTKEITLVVQHDGLPLGRFVLLAHAGVRVTKDELIAAVALSDQAGAALATGGRLAS